MTGLRHRGYACSPDNSKFVSWLHRAALITTAFWQVLVAIARKQAASPTLFRFRFHVTYNTRYVELRQPLIANA